MVPWLRLEKIILFVLSLLVLLGLCSCDFFESRVSVEQQAPMQFPRIDLGTAVVYGKIYAIGGYADQTIPYVEEYDPDTGIWIRKTDMPTARRCFAIGVIDNLIYVTGGMDFTDPNNVTYLYSTEIYNPLTDTWTTGSDFPMVPPFNSVFGNAFISGVAIEDKLYVVVDNSEETDGSATYIYDPLTDSWTEGSAPADVYSWQYYGYWGDNEFNVIAGNNQIYLFCCGDLFMYDPVSDFWANMATAWSTRYYGSANVLDDRIYAIYGIDSSDNPIPGVEVYYTDKNQWTRQGWIKNPRVFYSSISLNESVYILGGAYYANREWCIPLNLVERVFMRE